jgi:aspartate/methionine/tyrosine aminotransferase
MKHPSLYLDWYVHVPEIRHDFRSSGIADFKYNINLGETDLSINYAHGNPETARLLAQRYNVRAENVFISSEGASGQNARIIRYLAERNRKKNEAIVEYPTYEPLLRLAHEYFPHVKRLERKEKEDYGIDADALRRVASEKTALLVLTNPHAPSGAISNANDLKEVMTVAREYGFYVFCDEIYAEFDRDTVPTAFSVDPESAIVTTSYSKAYGLGGLKLGIALADRELVDGLYTDVLNTVGNSPNIVQLIASELLAKGKQSLETHKQKWAFLKKLTEEWLNEKSLEYFPNRVGVTYWVRLPLRDAYKWTTEHSIPRYSLAAVPGTFFLFKNGYKLSESDRVRLSLGNINPNEPTLTDALEAFEKALNTYKGF